MSPPLIICAILVIDSSLRPSFAIAVIKCIVREAFRILSRTLLEAIEVWGRYPRKLFYKCLAESEDLKTSTIVG